MTTTVAAALAVVSALCLFNLFLLTAVIRRLRAHEAQHAPVDLPLPAAGRAVGSFVTTEPDAVSDQDLAEPAVVLFVMPNCSPCHELVESAPGAGLDPGRTFVFVAGDPAEAATREVVSAVRLLGRVSVVAPDGPVTAAFGGITGFPTVLRVEAGRVVAAGRDLGVLRAALTGSR